MRFILLMILLFVPSLSYGMSKEVSYDTNGVKKQNIKKPFYYDRGFHFETENGLFSTNLQWRAQMRLSTPLLSDPRTPEDFSNDSDITNFELRRVRMKIGGHGYQPWIKYYFEVDLQPSRNINDATANSSSRLIDWRIDVQPYEELGFRVGQWKINYNRERVDSSGRQQFVERSIVNRVFNIDRQVGFMIKGRFAKKTPFDMRYYAGVFNGNGRSVSNSSKKLMKMARIQWNPFGRELKWRQSDVIRHKKPTLSLAAAVVDNTGDCTRWSSGGCGSLDGLQIGSDDQYNVKQYVTEMAYKYQGLSLQTEYHWKDVKDNTSGALYDYEGMYSQIGYFFNELVSAFPEELELAFRYAFVDEPDPSNLLLENKRKEYTLGINYFLAGHNNKVTLDYSYLTLDDASDDRFYNDNRIRLQWDVSF